MGFDRNMYQAISQFFLKISQLLFFSDHHMGMDFKKYFIRFGMTAVSEAAASIFPENMVHATILLNTVLKKNHFFSQNLSKFTKTSIAISYLCLNCIKKLYFQHFEAKM